MKRPLVLRVLVLVAAVLSGACAPVEDPSLQPEFNAALAEPPPRKAAVPADPLRNLLWGDLHIHTSYSTDAYTMGVRATPDDAYIFTRGGTIEHGAGYPIRMARPLDFAAVTDHSEFLGVTRQSDLGLPLEKRSLRERLLNDSRLSFTIAQLVTTIRINGGDLTVDVDHPEQIMIDSWGEIVEAAERHYLPGAFTTFAAYEWTSMPDSQNLHRNVVYRGTSVPERPFSSLDSDNPEDLWSVLDEQRDQGMEAFAIPHNGNVSNGLMYARHRFDGGELDAAYADQRLRNEPLSEILQIKGTSDTHPLLSPEDEFADFEIMNQQLSAEGAPSEPRGSYARDALRTGLEMAHKEGFNPYRFGVIGSSDSHNASTSVEEDNHHGKLPILDGSAALRLGLATLMPEPFQRQKSWGAAGLAAVWAQENTRESIYDAMRRRETYATSGPRIMLRFFGGWSFEPGMLNVPDLLEQAYAKGVPMGAQLEAVAPGLAPKFLVWAARDPLGANLDRIQIIKAWVDETGASHEQIFNVAASGDRRPDAQGGLPAVGNTVNVANASYSNNIGSAQLAVLWEDPDFDPARESFYYVRVLEIPTPRWSTYDARTLQVKAPDPVSLRERAISSAIWYQPE